jgi:hypothetical protein
VSDPLILLLSQGRPFRICRAEVFCPVEHCRYDREIRSIGKLARHLGSDHGASAEETADMILYSVRKMLPHQTQVVLSGDGEGGIKERGVACDATIRAGTPSTRVHTLERVTKARRRILNAWGGVGAQSGQFSG